jgi:hypothetical protein
MTSFFISSSNTVHLFYISNTHIIDASTTQSFGGFATKDLTANSSNGTPTGSSGSALTGFYLNTTYPEHVFFEAGNGHVHELWSNTSGAFYDSDLTAASGGTAARSASSLTSFYRDTTYPEHVFFQDANNHIHELWSGSNAAWHDSDLTAASNGSTAAAGSTLTGFYWNETYPEHVFFLDASGHVHELWSDSSAVWHDHDLTQLTGSGAQVYAASGMTSFFESGSYPEHVIYQNGTESTNANGGGTIHEMRLSSTGVWQDQNLTALTTAPLLSTLTFISGFATSDSNPEHAFYVDSQGSVHELWFGNSTWHDQVALQGSLQGLSAEPGSLTALSVNGSSVEGVFFYQIYPGPGFSLGGADDYGGGWGRDINMPTY